MPFFTNKLLNKKTSKRKFVKSQIKHDEDDHFDQPITLKLGDLKTTFNNGRWIPQFGPYSETSKENSTLKSQVTQLKEENNLLKLKYEILLDMLTQKSMPVNQEV